MTILNQHEDYRQANNAYSYPLIIKHLLDRARVVSCDQTIHYADKATLANADSEFEFEDFDENTIATTFYTSGTTGNPKGVFFTHRQLVLHTITQTIASSHNTNAKGTHYDDVYMPMTPMFHVHAWGMPYASTMLGLKQIYPSRYVPSHLLDLIQEHNVSLTHCVPAILQMLLVEAAKRGQTFNGLKMIIGGSKLTEGLAKQALQSGIEVMTGYGMSETGPIVTITKFDKNFEQLSLEDQIKHRCQAGSPVPLVELAIWNSEGHTLPNDGKATGEVVMRTPWLTQSYFKNHDAGDELWEGGYLHTQDIGYITHNGQLQITDRLKDVIKTGGEWVSSLEIETILSLHPSVADLAVIGIPDSRWGGRPLALVVLKPDHQDTTAQDILAIGLQAVERGLIPKYDIPDEVKILSELPKTSVGKLDKKVMRQMYADRLFNT